MPRSPSMPETPLAPAPPAEIAGEDRGDVWPDFSPSPEPTCEEVAMVEVPAQLAVGDADRRRKRDVVKRAASRFLSRVSRRFGASGEAAAVDDRAGPKELDMTVVRTEPALVGASFATPVQSGAAMSFLAQSPSVLQACRQSSLGRTKSLQLYSATFAEQDAPSVTRKTSVEGDSFHKLLHAQTMGRLVHHGKRGVRRTTSLA